MIVDTPRSAVNIAGAVRSVRRRLLRLARGPVPLERPSLDRLAAPGYTLPCFVRECPVAMRYLDLLGALPWSDFPSASDGSALAGTAAGAAGTVRGGLPG